MNVVTGPKRGVLHCFICETADKPAVIIFAHALRLARQVGRRHRQGDGPLQGPPQLDHFPALRPRRLRPQARGVARKHAIANVPLAVVEDLAGPPGYTINKDADVTVLLSVKQKVVANFAFRAGDLTDARVDEILKAMEEFDEVPPAGGI